MGWGDKFKRTDSGKGLIINPTPQPPSAADHLGRALHPGDEVLVIAPSTTWRVQALDAVLEPGAPPGLVKLTLVAVAHAVVPSGERVEGMYRLRGVAELEQPPADGPEQPTPDQKPTTLVVD